MRSDGKAVRGTDSGGGCAQCALIPFPGRREGETERTFGYCPLTPGMTRAPYASIVASWASCMS